MDRERLPEAAGSHPGPQGVRESCVEGLPGAGRHLGELPVVPAPGPEKVREVRKAREHDREGPRVDLDGGEPRDGEAGRYSPRGPGAAGGAWEGAPVASPWRRSKKPRPAAGTPAPPSLNTTRPPALRTRRTSA